MDVELVGAFVEDADLLHFAGLPFAREVGYPSAARRTHDVGTMERSLRATLGELRREAFRPARAPQQRATRA